MRIPSTDIYPFNPFDDFYEDFCNRIQDGENPDKLLNNLNNTIFIFCIGKAKDIYWRETDRLERKNIVSFWKWQIKKLLDRINNDSCTNPYKEIFEEGFQYFSNHINEECENCLNKHEDQITERRKLSLSSTFNIEKKRGLRSLHRELLAEGFISPIVYKDFESHFVNRDNTLPPIQWLKTLNQLHYFIDKLEDDGIVSMKGKWIFTVNIFQHNGETIQIGQLQHTQLKDSKLKKNDTTLKDTINHIIEVSFRTP